MASVSDAMKIRGALVAAMAHPEHGGAIAGFAGAGLLWDKFKQGWASIKPVAYSALSQGLQGFAKGFSGSEGELGQRALAGLESGLKAAGQTFAKGVSDKLNQKGGSISGFSGAELMKVGSAGVKSQALQRKMARPKI